MVDPLPVAACDVRRILAQMLQMRNECAGAGSDKVLDEVPVGRSWRLAVWSTSSNTLQRAEQLVLCKEVLGMDHLCRSQCCIGQVNVVEQLVSDFQSH